MKRYCFLLVLFILAGSVFGQARQRDMIYAEKVAFFTRTLKMSPEEARLFWPVYDEFTELRDSLIAERNRIIQNTGRNHMNMNEEELDDAGDRIVELNLKEAELRADYHKKFKEVLEPGKAVRVYYAETRFKTYLLNQLRSRREISLENTRRRF